MFTKKFILAGLTALSLICLLFLIDGNIVKDAEDGADNSLINESTMTWPDLSKAVDMLFKDYDKPYHPGGVAAVLYAGELIHLKGYGAANREFNVPWTADTLYRIASETKGYTANALLLLEDQNLLNLDDSVRKHLPEFPDFGVPVKLRHCLQMSSGLWHDEYLMILSGTTSVDSRDEMYNLTCGQKQLDFIPGSYLQWSDTNFKIIARVIEKVTGKPYAEAMADLIFDPLGLKSTSAPADFTEVFDNQATTYTVMPDGAWPPNEIRVGFPLSGGGSIITTMNDQILWIKNLVEEDENGESMFNRMTEILSFPGGAPASYRLGIESLYHRGLKGWGLSGHTGTQWAHFPEIELSISYFINYLEGINMENITRGMIDAFLKAQKNPYPYYFSNENPHKDHLFSAPPSSIPEKEIKYLVGTYTEPQRGYTLTLSTHNGCGLKCALLTGGEGPYLLKAGKGRYETDYTRAPVPRIRIEVESADESRRPALLVRDADWTKPRRFAPVSIRNLEDIPSNDYTGYYYSENLDAFHSVKKEGDKLLLRAGAGLHGMHQFVLKPYGDDIFEGRAMGFGEIATHYLALKFERNSANRVIAMRLSVNNVRDLMLKRVACQ